MFTKQSSHCKKIAKVVQPLLSGKPLLSGHLPFPGGWPLNRGSTVIRTPIKGKERGKLEEVDGWERPQACHCFLCFYEHRMNAKIMIGQN